MNGWEVVSASDEWAKQPLEVELGKGGGEGWETSAEWWKREGVWAGGQGYLPLLQGTADYVPALHTRLPGGVQERALRLPDSLGRGRFSFSLFDWGGGAWRAWRGEGATA